MHASSPRSEPCQGSPHRSKTFNLINIAVSPIWNSIEVGKQDSEKSFKIEILSSSSQGGVVHLHRIGRAWIILKLSAYSELLYRWMFLGNLINFLCRNSKLNQLNNSLSYKKIFHRSDQKRLSDDRSTTFVSCNCISDPQPFAGLTWIEYGMKICSYDAISRDCTKPTDWKSILTVSLAANLPVMKVIQMLDRVGVVRAFTYELRQ